MSVNWRSLTVIGLALMTGCATSQGMAPAPFSAEQIRDATAPGRAYRFLVTADGRPDVGREVRFVRTGERGCTIEGQSYRADGESMGQPKRSEALWDDLVGHAAYPEDHTVITQTEVEVPAGRFEARLYTVTAGATVTRAWFADALPGAPVRHEVTRLVGPGDGVVVSSMILVSHKAGTP
ncbi:MAG: hypothetical protein ACI9WU_004273 [Myxococcota bacterium]|jgi:hypothetical protein